MKKTAAKTKAKSKAKSKPVNQSHLITVDQFSKHSKNLRQYFDEQFADPKETHNKRFVWDYWHVPGQYSLLRTPAYHYFPEELYMKIHHELVHWGRRNLGCWDISPPWMSCYIDGCSQNFHSDVPHGPWAFVLSLSPWETDPSKRKFTGGNTMILKPEILNYWQNFSRMNDREADGILDLIEPKMNRLVVFDPRYPHGVQEVHGSKDPREGRLVIHGWFTLPKTYIEGSLAVSKSKHQHTENVLNTGFQLLQEALTHYSEMIQGALSLELQINANGDCTKTQFLTFNAIDDRGQKSVQLKKEILAIYKSLKFAKSKGKTTAVVPLLFE